MIHALHIITRAALRATGRLAQAEDLAGRGTEAELRIARKCLRDVADDFAELAEQLRELADRTPEVPG